MKIWISAIMCEASSRLLSTLLTTSVFLHPTLFISAVKLTQCISVLSQIQNCVSGWKDAYPISAQLEFS